MNNQKGQISFETMLMVPVFIIVAYATFLILGTINNDVMFPLLDNASLITHGPTIKLLIQLIPLMIILLIVVWIIRPKPPTQYYDAQPPAGF